MRTILFPLLGIALLLLAASVVASADRSDQATDGPVNVRLLSDLTAQNDGTPGRLGVLLTMDPGWHVYWRNPGDSGLPTEVRWNAPDGVQIGEPSWPTPERFSDPAGHESFGYSEEVVLQSSIDTLRSGASPGAVAAEVSWLACKEKCVLGGATVELRLPVSAATATENRKLMDTWATRLPRVVPDDQQPFAITVREAPGDAPNTLAIQAFLKWNEAPAAGTIEWFPIAPDATKIQSARARTRANLTRIDIELRIEKRSDVPGSLASVLVFGTKPNQTSLMLELPLSS